MIVDESAKRYYEFVKSLTLSDRLLLEKELGLEWRQLARIDQLPSPDWGDWRTWYIRGGRGSGKTWAGSNNFAEFIRNYPGREWAIVAPTFGDARDVCIEGDKSGLLASLGLKRSFKGWNRSYGELFLPDGGVVYCDGADDGALRIQGKNLSGVWCDEVGLWRQWKRAWEESIAYAVRIAPAIKIATGTPKRGHPLVKLLLHDPQVPTTRLRTKDNAANLSPEALADLDRRYSGTELGRQELEGEELTDVPGAMVRAEMLRYGDAPLTAQAGTIKPTYLRVVVAIDPAGSYGVDSDETGITVEARGIDGNGYVLDDLSGKFSASEWPRRAINAHVEYEADAIVAETNFGGNMVEAALRGAGFAGRFIGVTASRGKRIRAEPIAAGYQRQLDPTASGYRIFHRRPFPELEDQWTTFTPESLDSPDRLDSEVWGFTELFPPVQVITGDFVLSG